MEYVVYTAFLIFTSFQKLKKCIKLNVLYEKFDFAIQQVLIDLKSKLYTLLVLLLCFLLVIILILSFSESWLNG